MKKILAYLHSKFVYNYLNNLFKLTGMTQNHAGTDYCNDNMGLHAWSSQIIHS